MSWIFFPRNSDKLDKELPYENWFRSLSIGLCWLKVFHVSCCAIAMDAVVDTTDWASSCMLIVHVTYHILKESSNEHFWFLTYVGLWCNEVFGVVSVNWAVRSHSKMAQVISRHFMLLPSWCLSLICLVSCLVWGPAVTFLSHRILG